MPLPFPAKHGTLAVLLKQEGWKQEGDASSLQNEAGDLTATWWNRGKHCVVLVEQEGRGDMLFRPISEPHALAVTIASRRKSKPGTGRQPSGHKLTVL